MICLVFCFEEGKGSEARRGRRRAKERIEVTEGKEWVDSAVEPKLLNLKRDQKREGSIGVVEEGGERREEERDGRIRDEERGLRQTVRVFC